MFAAGLGVLKNRKKEAEGMRLGGKYELGRTLGEGNFGKVKYATDLETGKVFAVKVLEKERIVQLKITEQIKREISILKLLKHPNVVRLYEVSNRYHPSFTPFVIQVTSLLIWWQSMDASS
ncbi:unnamed protein product [Rhodiola kirilowii]